MTKGLVLTAVQSCMNAVEVIHIMIPMYMHICTYERKCCIRDNVVVSVSCSMKCCEKLPSMF